MGLVRDIVIYFVLFAFCGWICETVFCSIVEKKPVNRGFLSGPVCPVYGFGGLIVVYVLGPLQGNYPLLFLWGMVACSILEYITSWILEVLFNAKWWDYSDQKLNINGRVCLKFSAIFGGLSIVAVELLYPPFTALLARIPATAKTWLAGGFVLVLLADCVTTVHAIVKLNGKLAEIKASMDELKVKLESVQGTHHMPFSQRIEEFRADRSQKYEAVRQSVQSNLAKLEKLTGRQGFQHRRILRAFPNMKSTKYQEQFAKIKESINALGKKIKKKEEN